MALATYSDLQAAIASWLARDDLTTQIPDFVTLFEAVANRRLRVRQQETSTTLTPSSGVASLPSDYLMWRTVTYGGSNGGELEFKHPGWLRSAYPGGETGTAKYFTIEGSNLVVAPSDDTTLTFRYYEKIDALSGTVNWLYSAHPDAYLFGSLVEAYTFLCDEQRALVWKERRDGVFDEIEKLSNKSRAGSISPMGSIV